MMEQILKVINHHYPVTIVGLAAVTDEMFRCSTTSQGDYFARVSDYKSYEEQLAEVTYTNYLQHRGLAVPAALPTLTGAVVLQAQLDERTVSIVLYQGAPGRHLPKQEWNAEVLKVLGRQIGTLHRLSAEFAAEFPTQHLNDWHQNDEYDFLAHIPEEETTIRAVAEKVVAELKAIPQDQLNYGITHGDLWLENVLVTADFTLTLIDFQDYEKNFYLYDLVVPLYSAMEFSFVGGGNLAEYGQQLSAAILAGYQEERALSPAMLAKLPLFFKLKELFEYNLMHLYWDHQQLTEEQVRLLNHYRLRLENNYSLFKN